MVKGVSRRVIVVDSPDRRYFEQAIFILRSDIPGNDVRKNSPAVNEACRIAARYMKRCHTRPPRSIPAPVWFLLGAALVCLLWLITSL